MTDFRVKVPEICRKKIFRDKENTNKILLTFLNVKVLKER